MKKHFGVSMALALLLLACLSCEEGPKKGPTTAMKTSRKTSAGTSKDVPGACECAIGCAHNTMIDDSVGLAACKRACADEFGVKATTQGFKRAVEVMSQDRESCED